MASPIPQFRTWDTAKSLTKKFRMDEAIALYAEIETDMLNMAQWRDKPERDIWFDQAAFFGDYCGALADAGLYAEALEKGNLALRFMKQGSFTTLKYIYYNMGRSCFRKTIRRRANGTNGRWRARAITIPSYRI